MSKISFDSHLIEADPFGSVACSQMIVFSMLRSQAFYLMAIWWHRPRPEEERKIY